MSLADLRNRGAAYSAQRSPVTRYIGFGLVAAFHVAIIYALVTGLAHRAIDVVRAPIETKIIEEVQPEKRAPPPPPPQFAPPPLPFVPPPEIHIETPPPPPRSTAPIVVTAVKPPAPPVTAPPPEPVR
ncbi:MAG: hypothetical protein ACREEA_12290, partial [Stellaceae bacterium]